ncbi:MAG: hypothetical protein R6U19_03655, partial [Bacteroidales bacterium]
MSNNADIGHYGQTLFSKALSKIHKQNPAYIVMHTQTLAKKQSYETSITGITVPKKCLHQFRGMLGEAVGTLSRGKHILPRSQYGAVGE